MSPTQSRTTLTSAISSARDAKAHPRTSPASSAGVRPRQPRGMGGAGQGRAAGRAQVEPRELGARRGPAGPGRTARRAGREPGPRARPHPPRAHAGLAVHVLPRRRVHHGGGPRPDAGLRLRGAAVRRRAPAELRPVRVARAADAVRHQRLRRDAPRPVGVGREAPGGELRGRRPRPRLLAVRPA